jgi:hypothetical protein
MTTSFPQTIAFLNSAPCNSTLAPFDAAKYPHRESALILTFDLNQLVFAGCSPCLAVSNRIREVKVSAGSSCFNSEDFDSFHFCATDLPVSVADYAIICPF